LAALRVVDLGRDLASENNRREQLRDFERPLNDGSVVAATTLLQQDASPSRHLDNIQHHQWFSINQSSILNLPLLVNLNSQTKSLNLLCCKKVT
jgi:hypothetical protein